MSKNTTSTLVILVAAALLGGCQLIVDFDRERIEADAGPQVDSGMADAGSDAGPIDGGAMVDAGPDAGPMDAGPMDAGPVDAGPPPDAGPNCGDRVVQAGEACDDGNELACGTCAMDCMSVVGMPSAGSVTFTALPDDGSSITIGDGVIDLVFEVDRANLATAEVSGLAFTAVEIGAEGDGINIEIVDPGAASSPLSANYNDGTNTLTVSLETDAAPMLVSTQDEVIAAVTALVGAMFPLAAPTLASGAGTDLAAPGTAMTAGGAPDGVTAGSIAVLANTGEAVADFVPRFVDAVDMSALLVAAAIGSAPEIVDIDHLRVGTDGNVAIMEADDDFMAMGLEGGLGSACAVDVGCVEDADCASGVCGDDFLCD